MVQDFGYSVIVGVLDVVVVAIVAHTSCCPTFVRLGISMFSCLSRIDSLDSLEAFRFDEQQATHKQTSTTVKGVTRPTAIRQPVSLILSVFESHAPDAHFLSSPQHCPVEHSSSVLHPLN